MMARYITQTINLIWNYVFILNLSTPTQPRHVQPTKSLYENIQQQKTELAFYENDLLLFN